MVDTLEVGDVVVAMGHTGRWEITKLENNSASVKLLAKSVDGPVELGFEMHKIPVSTLVLLKKGEDNTGRA